MAERERRYDDDEVREIFRAATEAEEPRGGAGRGGDAAGFTLAELQEIGREVGIGAGRIERAARGLDRAAASAPAASRRTVAGLPLAVARTVPLPRAPTDAEWARLVAELRATFHANGRLGGDPALREWRNGMLHAVVEPTEGGHRLRMGSLKRSARNLGRLGSVMILVGIVAFVVNVLGGDPAEGLRVLGILGGWGALAAGSQLVVLPRWARRREAQMEHIAEVATRMLEAPAPGAG